MRASERVWRAAIQAAASNGSSSSNGGGGGGVVGFSSVYVTATAAADAVALAGTKISAKLSARVGACVRAVAALHSRERVLPPARPAVTF